jgi:hypothetical protein
MKNKEKVGGRDRDRTGDPLLAKQVLSQLSYTPTVGVTFILEHFLSRRNPFLRVSISTVPKSHKNSRRRYADRTSPRDPYGLRDLCFPCVQKLSLFNTSRNFLRPWNARDFTA